MRLGWVLVLAAASFMLATLVVTAAEPGAEEASAAGQKWLALLDDQKYEASWIQAGTMFRSEVKQEQWIASLKQFRDPLGTMISRATSRVDFVKTLRGAPDGDYAIIHFTTSFKNKDAVTERLTLVKEDGKWQMAAYAIH
jgi:Protein of unknown function (DUF4019)